MSVRGQSGTGRLTLSLGICDNPRTRPIIDGSIAAEGIELIPTVLHPSELFWRQLHFAEFDVSEMSMSSLMMATAHGDQRWVGLPVFTTRRFFHSAILVRRDAGIHSPADLRGKRVGVPEYQQTAALWTRGALQHEFGVTAPEMEWWMERAPERSHGRSTGFKPPPGVTVHTVAAQTSLGQMMVDGEIDAVVHYIRKSNLVDRSTVDLWNHPDIRPIFADPVAEGVRYWNKTGLYPINHGMVVKRELAERHPWVVLNLLKAFNAANAKAEAQRLEHVEYHIATGLVPPQAGRDLGRTLLRHGIGANRQVLETIAQYSNEQGLTPRRMTLAELFAPSVLEE